MNDDEEISPELKEFIDQLIVPLLVARLTNGELVYEDVASMMEAAESK